MLLPNMDHLGNMFWLSAVLLSSKIQYSVSMCVLPLACIKTYPHVSFHKRLGVSLNMHPHRDYVYMEFCN